jgi:ribonucleoside-diphosphate reductase beta chain
MAPSIFFIAADIISNLLTNAGENTLKGKVTNLTNIARSLALFSACAEGIQLYSSFAVLLSFRKKNLMTGIGQQMIFSVRDESLHSESGCKLFRTLVEENPYIWTEELKDTIYQGVDLAITNEFNYIDKIFELGDLETTNLKQILNYTIIESNGKILCQDSNDKTYHLEEII